MIAPLPRWRRVGRLCVATTLVFVGSVTMLTPSALGASAGSTSGFSASPSATGLVGLSRDGRSWAGQLDQPLFDSALRWVPGDVRTARLWVRNQAPDSGDVSVEFRPGVGFASGADSLDITARAVGGPWQKLDEPRNHDLIAGDGLAPGDAVALDLRVAMPFSTRDAAMTMASDFGFDVTVADTTAVAAQEGQATSAQAMLPTALPLPLWGTVLAVLLAVMTAFGVLLPVRRRRELADEV